MAHLLAINEISIKNIYINNNQKFILFVYMLKFGCSHSIGLAYMVFQTLRNILKHTRINVMVIVELRPKATKIRGDN